MRYFFIDSENVQQYNFIEELELGANDKIIMLISDKSQKIRIKDLKRFTCCKSVIEYENVYTGCKNAMDFQLITNLALTIAKNNEQDSTYFVVSNDNDFKLPIEYLKNKTGANINVLKTEVNSHINDKVDEVAITTDIAKSSDYKNLKLDKVVLDIIKESKNLSKLHNSLREKYGNEKGRKTYLQVKDYFKLIK